MAYSAYKGKKDPTVKKPDTVFHKFVVQSDKLKRIKEICTKNLDPSVSQLLQKEFKHILDIVEDKNENK